MANQQNLVQWKPGQSGNPAGGRKNRPMVTPALRRLMAVDGLDIMRMVLAYRAAWKIAADPKRASEKLGITLAQLEALLLVEKSLDVDYGDKAREMILARIDGKETIVEDDTDADSEKTPIIYQGVPPMLFGKKA
jgi:hypothetical protein